MKIIKPRTFRESFVCAALQCVYQSDSDFLYDAHQDLLHLEERLGTVNRGASQGTIERCTYPHKYKKVRTGVYFTIYYILKLVYVVMHVICSVFWVFWDRVRGGLLCSFQTSDVFPTFRKYCSVFH